MRPTFTEAEVRILIRAALLQKSVLADQMIQLRLSEMLPPDDEDAVYTDLAAVQGALDKLTRALPKP